MYVKKLISLRFWKNSTREVLVFAGKKTKEQTKQKGHNPN